MFREPQFQAGMRGFRGFIQPSEAGGCCFARSLTSRSASAESLGICGAHGAIVALVAPPGVGMQEVGGVRCLSCGALLSKRAA